MKSWLKAGAGCWNRQPEARSGHKGMSKGVFSGMNSAARRLAGAGSTLGIPGASSASARVGELIVSPSAVRSTNGWPPPKTKSHDGLKVAQVTPASRRCNPVVTRQMKSSKNTRAFAGAAPSSQPTSGISSATNPQNGNLKLMVVTCPFSDNVATRSAERSNPGNRAPLRAILTVLPSLPTLTLRVGFPENRAVLIPHCALLLAVTVTQVDVQANETSPKTSVCTSEGLMTLPGLLAGSFHSACTEPALETRNFSEESSWRKLSVFSTDRLNGIGFMAVSCLNCFL